MALTQKINTAEAISIWRNDVSDIFLSDNINVYEIMDMLKKIKSDTPTKDSYIKDRANTVKFLKSLNIQTLNNSNKLLIASCTDVTDTPEELRNIKAAIGWYENSQFGNPAYLTLNNQSDENLIKILLASSAIPLIYQSVEIDNKYYVDGGLTDNLPIKPLYERKYKNIIVIPCSYVNENRLKSIYSMSKLHIIKPSIDLGNLINGTLNFNKSKINKMIKLGYSDGINFIKTLYKL